MAYTSDDLGQPQVYVQSIPAGGRKFQISNAGGFQPRWSHDGKELFFISTGNKLMSVPVKTGTAFEIAGSAQELFEIEPTADPSLLPTFSYQPTVDGRKFLVQAPVSGSTGAPITIVLNWQAGLKK